MLLGCQTSSMALGPTGIKVFTRSWKITRHSDHTQPEPLKISHVGEISFFLGTSGDFAGKQQADGIWSKCFGTKILSLVKREVLPSFLPGTAAGTLRLVCLPCLAGPGPPSLSEHGPSWLETSLKTLRHHGRKDGYPASICDPKRRYQ